MLELNGFKYAFGYKLFSKCINFQLNISLSINYNKLWDYFLYYLVLA